MFSILLATDSSSGALAAARYAASLCAELRDPLVTILHVKDFDSVSLPPIASFTGLGGMAARQDLIDWETLQASLDSASKEALEETGKVFEEAGVPFKLQTETGKPGEVICQVGERRNYNLIIMGSRGLGGLSGLVLGSVSNQVVYRSKVPVLVVR